MKSGKKREEFSEMSDITRFAFFFFITIYPKRKICVGV